MAPHLPLPPCVIHGGWGAGDDAGTRGRRQRGGAVGARGDFNEDCGGVGGCLGAGRRGGGGQVQWGLGRVRDEGCAVVEGFLIEGIHGGRQTGDDGGARDGQQPSGHAGISIRMEGGSGGAWGAMRVGKVGGGSGLVIALEMEGGRGVPAGAKQGGFLGVGGFVASGGVVRIWLFGGAGGEASQHLFMSFQQSP